MEFLQISPGPADLFPVIGKPNPATLNVRFLDGVMDMSDQWQIAAELRDLSMQYLQGQHVSYLLCYEVAALLSFIPDLQQRMLFELLFHCGGRINEVLALTPDDFALQSVRPFVILRTLKQRQNRARGRPKNDEPVKRLVPLLDPEFAQRLQDYLHTFGKKRAQRLYYITSQTARNWIATAVKEAKSQGIEFKVKISPHVFRHSYSMHLLLWGHIHMKRLQKYLGHKSQKSTERYTDLLAIDAAANEPPLSFTVRE